MLPPGAVPAATEPRYVPPPTGCAASASQWTVATRPTVSAAVTEPAERVQELPAAVRTAIEDLQEAAGCGTLKQVLHLLGRSEADAHRAAVTAARALAELNARATQLRANPDSLRRAKRAGLLVRDRVIWRCLGHQGSLFDSQRVQQFVFTHVTRTDTTSSQLTNAYQSILAELLQDLVLSDAWRRLINSLRLHPGTEGAQAILAKLERTYLECPFLRPPDGDASLLQASNAATAIKACQQARSGDGCEPVPPGAMTVVSSRMIANELPPGHCWIGHSYWPGREQSLLQIPVSRCKAKISTVEDILAMVLASTS